jgi:hypothetical protein
MLNIRYIDINLDQVEIWKPEVETPDYCENVFGSLGFLMHEYYKTFDLDIFDQNKPLIEKTFVDTLLHQKPVPVFFHKIDKLMMLKQYWLGNQKWRDPVVATFIGTKDNKPIYYAHPGRDRLGIMRYFDVKSYRFLNIDNEFIHENNSELIKSYWGEHQQTVVISRSIENLNRFVIGNRDGRETYHKFENLRRWLDSH